MTGTAAERDRPRLGLALGGGGARGFAHIGVIEALLAAGIPIDVVAGSSMGAIVGAAYRCGHDMGRLAKLLEDLDLHGLLDVAQNPIPELLERATSEYLFKRATWLNADSPKTQRLVAFFRLLTKRARFETLERPLAVVACDVNTGEQIVIDRGEVARALAASMALPGVHDPVRWESRLLVDGGIINKVPVNVAVTLGADVVVAVDVSGRITDPVQTSLAVLAQSNHITSRALMRTQLALMHEKLGERLVVLNPDVSAVRLLELGNVARPRRAGREEAEAAIPLIQRALARVRPAA